MKRLLPCLSAMLMAMLMASACDGGDSGGGGSDGSDGDAAVLNETPVENGGVEIASETWNLSGFAVGKRAGTHQPGEGGIIMSDIMTMADGTYRMYFTQVGAPPVYNNIQIATSQDGLSWTLAGTALAGAQDDNDRMRILGGPSVVILPDGRYRMFTRCSVWVQQGTPDYHIRSAISTDGGLTFADEGVVLDNSNHDPDSPWLTVAHGRFYQLEDGSWAAVLSVQSDFGPADLALFTSPDCEQWSYERILYVGWHDPVVVKRGSEYVMVAYYLLDYAGIMVSPDGLHWPAEFTRIEPNDPQGIRDVGGSAPGAFDAEDYDMGDYGALVKPDGSLLLFSNFRGLGDAESTCAVFQR